MSATLSLWQVLLLAGAVGVVLLLWAVCRAGAEADRRASKWEDDSSWR